MNNTQKIQLLLIILLNYFTFAIVTNITGVLFPFWKTDFKITSDAVIGMMPCFFFFAYGLTSLPQGLLLEKIGNKKTLLWGSALILLGSGVFALNPSFEIGLASLFIMGVGVTAMQIVGNLLVKQLDADPTKYSRNLTVVQVASGLGGSGGGFLIKYLVDGLNWSWISAYYVFGGLALALCLLALFSHIPEQEIAEEKRKKVDLKDYLSVAANPLMIVFALGIFIYVGIEVGVSNFISRFLGDKFSIAITNAGLVVSAYWFAQAIGRLVGGVVLDKLAAPKALTLYAIACLSSLMVGIYAPTSQIAIAGFVGAGFFTSIMFPCIFSLAVNSFDKTQEGAVAGVLCTAILGGAVITPVIGFISDKTGSLTLSLTIAGSVCLAYIAFVGIKALTSDKIENISADEALEETTPIA
ncbi:MAG TPA: MFS transporter [Vampirovibrionales bacterium]